MNYWTLYMDESGSGSQKVDTKKNLWVSVGIAAKLDDHDAIAEDVAKLRKKVLRRSNIEFKANDLTPKRMNDGITYDDVASGVAEILKKYSMKTWVMVVPFNLHIINMSMFTPSNAKSGLQAKDVAREMLLERVSMDVDRVHTVEDKFMIIWDLSNTNELMDFSASVLAHTNPHSGKKISPIITPHILGGLSHEWAELQLADLISNFGLNYAARGKYPDCDESKAMAFETHLYPCLQKSWWGCVKGYGWKYME